MSREEKKLFIEIAIPTFIAAIALVMIVLWAKSGFYPLGEWIC